jgi:hypothetical protein
VSVGIPEHRLPLAPRLIRRLVDDGRPGAAAALVTASTS